MQASAKSAPPDLLVRQHLREVIPMRVRLTLGLLLVAVFGVLPARPQVPRGSPLLVLTNANVIDGVSESRFGGPP